MVYDFFCKKCQRMFEAWGVKLADREKPRPCEYEGCDGEAEYDPISSMKGSRAARQMDLNTYLHNKFGDNPGWTPPQPGGGLGRRGRGNEGAAAYYPGDARYDRKEI